MGTTLATTVTTGMPRIQKEAVPSILNGQYDASMDANGSLDMQQMSEILQGFYDNFNNQTNYLLIALYVPVIVLAMTANLMVIIVVFKYHYMRSVTNYFVVNLSLADLLVTVICMPMAVSQAVSIIWVCGELMCKLFFYLQGVAVAASVFTITAMSVDRFLAIRNPIDFRKIFNRKSTKIVIAALWIIAFVIFSPILIAATLQSPNRDLDNITLAGHWAREESLKMPKPPTFYVCSEDFRPLGIPAHIFGAACFVLVYAIPGCIVIIMYSMMGRTLCARRPPFDCDSMEGSASSQQGFRLVRERRRVAWILLLLAVLFALCWLPYNVLRLLIDFGVLSQSKIITDVLSYCLFLGHANSALNPIVYCFMTRNFRRSVAEILCRHIYGSTQRTPHRKVSELGLSCWQLRRLQGQRSGAQQRSVPVEGLSWRQRQPRRALVAEPVCCTESRRLEPDDARDDDVRCSTGGGPNNGSAGAARSSRDPASVRIEQRIAEQRL